MGCYRDEIVLQQRLQLVWIRLIGDVLTFVLCVTPRDEL